MVNLEDKLKDILRTETGKTDNEMSEFYCKSGNSALEKKDYLSAKDEFFNALNWEQSSQGYKGLYSALLNLKQEEEAITIFANALEHLPANSLLAQYLKLIKSNTHYLLGVRLQSQQKYAQAVTQYKQAAEQGKDKFPELEEWEKEGVIKLGDWNNTLRFAKSLDEIIEVYHKNNSENPYSRTEIGYSSAKGLLIGINFNLKEIEFYFNNIFQNNSYFSELSCEFISAMINKIIKDDEEIILNVKTDLENLCYKHSKGKITINLSNKSHLYNIAEQMSGGEVIINGNFYSTKSVGQSMEGGKIKINNYCPLDIKNEKISIGENMKSGEIFIDSKKSFEVSIEKGDLFIKYKDSKVSIGRRASYKSKITIDGIDCKINSENGYHHIIECESLSIHNYCFGIVIFNGKQIIPSLDYKIRCFINSIVGKVGSPIATYTRNG